MRDRPPDFLEGPSADGATPIDLDEAEGLIPDHILTRGALNSWEQANILQAEAWVFSRRRGDILTVRFALELHRRMFDETWKWAGTFRRSDKNIGAYWITIPESVRDLLDDTGYGIEHRSHPIEETIVRFHHRLVSIHPFPSGNGRHGRLMADVLAWNEGLEPFTWGRSSFARPVDVRSQYLAALKAADQGDVSSLLRFVRS